MIKFLEGEKVILRPFAKEDLSEEYLRWINDRENDVFTEHAQFPHSLPQLEGYAKAKWRDRSCIWLAIIDKTTNKHVGNIELCNMDKVHQTCEYKIILDKAVHGQGLAKEASVLLIKYAFDVLNMHRISLGVHQDNQKAIGLYKKLGFIEEGRLRENFFRDGIRRDTIMMGLLKLEFNQ